MSAESDAPAAPGAASRVVLVTGMSGAGRSSALRALEDMGYEAVDNLPLSLLDGLVQPGRSLARPLAIGVDARTRDFRVDAVLERIDALRRLIGWEVRLLFVDCDDEVLRRRFTATRRRHPLALDRPVTAGIERERALMAPLRGRADILIDTSAFTLGDLRQQLQGHLGLDRAPEMALFVVSFSYGQGVPRDADIVFDVRFLSNPHYAPGLSHLTGRHTDVAQFIAADAAFSPFLEKLCDLLAPLLPHYDREGKSYLTIAVGCTGGRHRSVYVAERLATWLREMGRHVAVHHRDIDQVSST